MIGLAEAESTFENGFAFPSSPLTSWSQVLHDLRVFWARIEDSHNRPPHFRDSGWNILVYENLSEFLKVCICFSLI